MNCDLEFVGNRIKNKRKEKGISQGQLAERAGVSLPYISDIENGKKNISINVLVAISESLDVTPNYLLGIEEKNVDGISEELDSIFSNCSEQDKEILLKILRDAKSLIK